MIYLFKCVSPSEDSMHKVAFEMMRRGYQVVLLNDHVSKTPAPAIIESLRGQDVTIVSSDHIHIRNYHETFPFYTPPYLTLRETVARLKPKRVVLGLHDLAIPNFFTEVFDIIDFNVDVILSPGEPWTTALRKHPWRVEEVGWTKYFSDAPTYTIDKPVLFPGWIAYWVLHPDEFIKFVQPYVETHLIRLPNWLGSEQLTKLAPCLPISWSTFELMKAAPHVITSGGSGAYYEAALITGKNVEEIPGPPYAKLPHTIRADVDYHCNIDKVINCCTGQI